ncbi:MAG: thermonuclease family protein [Eubacteriaceae bacterium]
MRKKINNKHALVSCVIFIIVILGGCEGLNKLPPVATDNMKQETAEEKAQQNMEYEVKRVVDGDTIVLKNGEEDMKVRLIGVDTPESVHPDKSKNVPYGKVSSEFVKELLSGKNVKLEYDVSPTDKYGRVLAYVYLPDGKMLNEIILKEGHGVLMTIPPNVKYVDRFINAENSAKEERIGLWSGTSH